MIEAEVDAVGGHKSLYSDAYYDEADFWPRYGGGVYAAAKPRYDPKGRLLDLYAKAVRAPLTARRQGVDWGSGRDGGVTRGMSLRLERGRDSADGQDAASVRCSPASSARSPRIRITAYDGSSAGPADAPYTLHLTNERGLSYLLTAPGELGLARAYVAGDLDVTGTHPGDPYDFLRYMEENVTLPRPDRAGRGRPGAQHRPALAQAAAAAAPGGRAAVAPGPARPPALQDRATPRPSTTTTTCRTRSTSGCSARR